MAPSCSLCKATSPRWQAPLLFDEERFDAVASAALEVAALGSGRRSKSARRARSRGCAVSQNLELDGLSDLEDEGEAADTHTDKVKDGSSCTVLLEAVTPTAIEACSPARGRPPVPRAAKLEEGVVFLTCGLEQGHIPNDELNAVAKAAAGALGATQDKVFDAIQGVCDGVSNTGSYAVLVPESMEALDYCQWDGDGHYDLSRYKSKNPPTLGQVVRYCKMVDAARTAGKCVIHVASAGGVLCAMQAVLAGASSVLRCGALAQSAWEELQAAVPPPCVDECKAWDRFSPPFSVSGSTSSSSLTVLDCLSGLEVARDHGWVKYSTFDVDGWRYLRAKFDVSWLIPGLILAFANPSQTAENPRFPFLLQDSTCVDDIKLQQVNCNESLGGKSPSTACPESPGSRRTSKASTTSLPSLEGKDEWTDASMSKAGSGIALNPQEVPMPSPEYEAMHAGFVTYFRHNKVGLVVRLHYESECPQRDHVKVFSEAGLGMTAIEFPDGRSPSASVERGFLKTCAEFHKQSVDQGEPQTIAVHCKGGLGRTGATIGAYAAQELGINGKAFHGWSRMCRPGSVQTPEQERYLRAFEGNITRTQSQESASGLGRTISSARRLSARVFSSGLCGSRLQSKD